MRIFYKMSCGHIVDGGCGKTYRYCSVCNCDTVTEIIRGTRKGLEGRFARCGDKKVPSRWDLPGFIYRPDKEEDLYFLGRPARNGTTGSSGETKISLKRTEPKKFKTTEEEILYKEFTKELHKALAEKYAANQKAVLKARRLRDRINHGGKLTAEEKEFLDKETAREEEVLKKRREIAAENLKPRRKKIYPEATAPSAGPSSFPNGSPASNPAVSGSPAPERDAFGHLKRGRKKSIDKPIETGPEKTGFNSKMPPDNSLTEKLKSGTNPFADENNTAFEKKVEEEYERIGRKKKWKKSEEQIRREIAEKLARIKIEFDSPLPPEPVKQPKAPRKKPENPSS